ncbi:MAG TPA: dTDP-4-dehydrorhamnose 3,5-epimerase [Thermotogota bacterium]|nr:dTDP-4-dehydrorhamnose 3,5-epimerase [Thermotogota bacterium]
MNFNISEAPINGVFIIEPVAYSDNRGYFLELYNQKTLFDLGFTTPFVQDNFSISNKGVLRGLHYQIKHPQGKLVKAMRGAIFDIGVDLRIGSPTYLKWFGLVLSSENHKMLYFPGEFAHGFLALSDSAEVFFKCTDYYYPEFFTGIVWNDENINVEWPLEQYGIRNVILSESDNALKQISEVNIPFIFEHK